MFEEVLFFKLRTAIQHKTVKPTYLVSVSCPYPSASLPQPTDPHPTDARQAELIVYFLFLYCRWLEKEDFLEMLHVLSCFVQLKSVLLISCVFWIFFFSERWQSTLFHVVVVVVVLVMFLINVHACVNLPFSVGPDIVAACCCVCLCASIQLCHQYLHHLSCLLPSLLVL